MRFYALILAFVGLGYSQIEIKFTPEPKSVPASQIANLHSLIRWQIDLCNTASPGTAPRQLAWQTVSMASSIPFMDIADATLVLNSAVQRSFWGTVAHYASFAAAGAALGLAIAKGNANAITGLTISSILAPGVQTIAQGNLPSAVPLLNQLQWPISLQPGQCATDHQFAGKVTQKPQTVIMAIQ